MGATHSFTCAPYLLETAPKLGDQVAWGESNAVVFANSVLGARTQKYADYLDICAALVGRVPAAGPHLDEHRIATIVLDATHLAATLADELGDAFFPTLGYLCGNMAGSQVPVVVGLEKHHLPITQDDLKAFSAAFGTSGAAALYHMSGVTPEAPDAATALDGKPPAETIVLTAADLAVAWRSLDSGGGKSDGSDAVELVAVGNPHLSASECATLATLVSDGGADKHPDVSMVATIGRQVMAEAEEAGHIQILKDFGVDFVNDTCWCMLTEPVVPVASTALITNSGKYAHYAPGLVNKEVRFSSMAGCVVAARTGRAPTAPAWLSARSMSMQRYSSASAARASVARTSAASIPAWKSALRLARVLV